MALASFLAPCIGPSGAQQAATSTALVRDGVGSVIMEISAPAPSGTYCQNNVPIRAKFYQAFPAGTSVHLVCPSYM